MKVKVTVVYETDSQDIVAEGADWLEGRITVEDVVNDQGEACVSIEVVP